MKKNWKQVCLGDVCKKESSNIAQKDLNNVEGPYPIFGASGLIKNINFYRQNNEYISIVKDGAGIGRAMLLPAKSSVIGTMQYIIPNDMVNVRYLYHGIISMNLSKYFTGATIPHIYFKDYQKEKLPLPSISEQIAIAYILDKIIELIVQRHNQLKNIELLVKSQFIEMFGDPVTNPMGWKRIKIVDVAKVSCGYAFKSTEFVNSGVAIVRISDIINCRIELQNTVKFRSSFVIEHPEFSIHKNDILMAMSGTVGKPGLFDLDDPAVLNQRVACIKALSDVCASQFLFALIKSDYFQNEVQELSAGCAQPNISAKQIENISFPIPPLPFQNHFADFVRQADKSKFVLQIQ
jgi:type I restriction enzyme S subunit